MKTPTDSQTTPVLERLDVADCADLFQVHLHRQRYDFTLKAIASTDSVLEVGSGLGVFSSELAVAAGSYRGIEYDAETCSRAKLRVPNSGWITQGDAHSLDYGDNTFDTVVCLEVLEHLHDYRKALDEIRRVLKPGGKLIASIPYVKNGAPSKVNPHHLYEPGEVEFTAELTRRFGDVHLLYQRYTETVFETWARKLRMRRLMGLDSQYAKVSQGDPGEMKKVLLDEKRSGMILGLFVIASKPKIR